MQGCFKKTFVDAHASCFGKHKHRLISVSYESKPTATIPYLILC